MSYQKFLIIFSLVLAVVLGANYFLVQYYKVPTIVVYEDEAIPQKKLPKPIQNNRPKSLVQKNNFPKHKNEQKKYQEKSALDFYVEKYEPFDKKGNIYITQVVIDDGLAIAHGDLIVGTKESVEEAQKSNQLITISQPEKWPSSTIAFAIDSSIPRYQAAAIHNVLYEFSRLTKVQFVQRKDEKDYLYFKRGGSNCYSYVGFIGGKQPISLASGCTQREIGHEVMHALGFFHEHSREDRDEYVRIHWENISEEFHPQFRKIPWKGFDLKKHPYDPHSIMNYTSHAFALDPQMYSITLMDGDPLQVPDRLSVQDIRRINERFSE